MERMCFVIKEMLYWGVGIVARVHGYILRLNDAYEYNFTDKELHFLVIGLIGMALVLVIYPLFKWLSRRRHEMVITWIYVFTLMIVLTFAIEIGQKVTNTGNMEFADIMFGLIGFIAMFAVFSLVRILYHLIRNVIRRRRENKMESER